MNYRFRFNIKYVLPFIILLSIIFYLVGCDSSSSSSTTDDTEDIYGHYEQCNSYYTKYALCVDYCIDGGFCVEKCVDAWYEVFLDCCNDFDADVTCLAECYDQVETCFADTAPLDHESKFQCFLDFSDCSILCPPPVAQKENPEYPQED